MRRWIKQIMVWLVAAACGFAAALVICRWSGTAFGLFMWPVIAAGAGFVVAGVGFFSTEGKSEILYGGMPVLHDRADGDGGVKRRKKCVKKKYLTPFSFYAILSRWQ